MTIPLLPLRARFWRMLSIQWQRDPLASGSHLTGGRYNPKGVKALYLAADHAGAIAEYHRAGTRPGTLAAYDVSATHIADLTDADVLARAAIEPAVLHVPWRTIVAIERAMPPTWALTERLLKAGAQGALAPSIENPGGKNLVLWRWRDAIGKGDGARVALVDPDGELTP